jgi:hypothetical protein
MIDMLESNPARLPIPTKAMSIFTKKSVAELRLEAEKGTLRRSLGRLNLTA